MTRTTAIYIYDQVEVLDFAGPYEVFSTAARVAQRSDPRQDPPFTVSLLAAGPGPITARGGLKVMPDNSIAAAADPDILIIPGGIVHRELDHSALLQWIRAASQSAAITASVCTGSFLLAEAGLLSGRKATTHWEDLEDFKARYPDVKAVSDQRWVEEGNLITSAGISAGIDLSLWIVARLEGEMLAAATARQMDYRWQPCP